MGANHNNEINNANQKEANNGHISDFPERKEARPIPVPRRKKLGEGSHISNQSDREKRKNLMRGLLYGVSNDHLQKLITYQKELMAAQLEQDIPLLEPETTKNIVIEAPAEVIKEPLPVPETTKEEPKSLLDTLIEEQLQVIESQQKRPKK